MPEAMDLEAQQTPAVHVPAKSGCTFRTYATLLLLSLVGATLMVFGATGGLSRLRPICSGAGPFNA